MFSKYYKMVSTLFIRSLVILYWKWNWNFEASIFWMGAGSGPCRTELPIILLRSVIKISKVSTQVLVYQLGQNVEEIQLAVKQSICSKSLISYFVCNWTEAYIFPNIYWLSLIFFFCGQRTNIDKRHISFLLRKIQLERKARIRLNCKNKRANYLHLISVTTDRSFCSIIPPSMKCL